MKKKCRNMGLVLLVIVGFVICQFNFINQNVKAIAPTNDFSRQNFVTKGSANDYLVTAQGTEFYVFVNSEYDVFDAYTEYFINVTVQVISFGTDVVRLYDMNFYLTMVWATGNWNTSIREVPEIDTAGEYNYTIFGVAMNEGDIGSLADNEEVPMTLWYHLEVTEDIVLWFDETSIGDFSTFSLTYRNIMPTAVDGIFDVDLPVIYSDYETKMSINVRTNANWKTNKAMTFIVSFTAEEFPWDVDRLHTIQFEPHFLYGGHNYYATATPDLVVALGDTVTYEFYIEFSDSHFGGLSLGQQITVELWYLMYYKEDVWLAIDNEYLVGPKYIYDITLTNEADDIPIGAQQIHYLELDSSMVLSHMVSKSLYYDGPNIWWNFTMFFAFNIYIETESTIILESYTKEEISNMDPFELFLFLDSQDIDVSIGAKPELGVSLNWIKKSDMSEYSFEVRDLPVPTPTDVDGDGTNVDIFGTTVYLWDSAIWTNGSLTDTLGDFIIVQDGITIDLAQIDLMQYINMLLSTPIPSWLLQLNLILAIHVYPAIYQLLAFDYLESGLTLTPQDDGLIGFLDFDSTDSADIDDISKGTLTPIAESSCSIDATPVLFTYSYSEVLGSLDIEFELLGFSLYRAPIINLVSNEEDSYSIVSYASESFTRYINYIPPMTTPTPSPYPSPTPTPTPSPSPSTTPTPTSEIGIAFAIGVVLIGTTTTVIILSRRIRKK